jgi:hypothetical protein
VPLADGYQITGTRAGTAWLGGTNTQPVVIVECQTLPDLVYYEVNVPQQGYTAGSARASAIGYAAIFNTILTLDNVAGVYWSQPPGKGDELVDSANILVQSASGNSQAYYGPIALTDLGPELHQAEINALSAELTNSEG